MKFNISLLDLLNSKTKIKITKFLINHRASMSEREIASVLKVSHMSVNRTLQELANVNMVNFVTIGKAHLWKVNCESYAYNVLSQLLTGIFKVKEPLEDLKNTLLKHLPLSLIKKIVLFGSIAKNLEKVDSDIDVFILVQNNTNKEKLEPLIEKLSNICIDAYGNRLSPYILTEKEIKQKKESNIISDINNGIQIYPKKKG